MAKIYNGRDYGCTTVPNQILYDRKLSWEAKGVLALLFSFGADKGFIEEDVDALRWYGVEKRHLDELARNGYFEIVYGERGQ